MLSDSSLMNAPTQAVGVLSDSSLTNAPTQAPLDAETQKTHSCISNILEAETQPISGEKGDNSLPQDFGQLKNVDNKNQPNLDNIKTTDALELSSVGKEALEHMNDEMGEDIFMVPSTQEEDS